jgi:hypothetical protein
MNIRFVTKTVHAYLDYPVAASLIATPFILGLGQVNPLALWVSVVTGITALLLTLVTDHKTGVVALVPYIVHLWVDRLVGVVFLAVPAVLGLTGLDAAYYWANGLAVLLVTVVLSAADTSRRSSIEPAHA